MIKHMVKVFILIWTGPLIKVNGSKINKMEMVMKLGQMELNIKVNIFKAKNKVKEFLLGMISPDMKETSLIIILKDKENMFGGITENM